MLNRIKAISYAIITIIVLGLVNQLVLIMALVAYGSMARTYPSLVAWTSVFTYGLAASGYFIVMFSGGFISAMSARKYQISNALIASLLGSTVSLYLSLQSEIFTPIALFFLIFGVLSAAYGSQVCYKRQQRNKF